MPESPKKSKAAKARGTDSDSSARPRRWKFQLAALVIALIGAAIGFRRMERFVDRRAAFPAGPPRLVLVDRPVWMSDGVVDQIEYRARPAIARGVFDRQLLVDVADLLKSSPWVKQVKQVRRVYDKSPGDTLQIECEYRAPIALVHWRDYYWLVDADCVQLPEQYDARHVSKVTHTADGETNLRIIEGVAADPPGAGRKWPGGDLAAGLELARALYGRDFAQEICRIDVSNFDHRVTRGSAAQIVLFTTHSNSQIQWGQPISAKDFFDEISPQRKLDILASNVAKFGHVDRNQPWINLQFDDPSVPPETREATAR